MFIMKNMKRLLTVLAGLALVSSASAAGVGAHFGFGAIGGHYTHTLNPKADVRGSLEWVFPGMLGGEAAYLMPLTQSTTTNNYNFYAGGGLAFNYIFVPNGTYSAGMVLLYPEGIAGLNYKINSQFSVYGEVGLGATIAIASAGKGNASQTAGGLVGPFFAPRIGVTYNLDK